MWRIGSLHPEQHYKCISFSIEKLHFIDGALFLLAFLDKLVYAFEYMDSLESFEEPQLPPKEAFLSKI
ncbi:MAG: hypothetical protein ABW185_16190 [Sedimenticola sp.]